MSGPGGGLDLARSGAAPVDRIRPRFDLEVPAIGGETVSRFELAAHPIRSGIVPAVGYRGPVPPDAAQGKMQVPGVVAPSREGVETHRHRPLPRDSSGGRIRGRGGIRPERQDDMLRGEAQAGPKPPHNLHGGGDFSRRSAGHRGQE